MQAEASTKLLTQERQFKAEIVDLRNRVTFLEDDVTRAEEESSVARAKADSLQVMCKQLEQARQDAVENQTRLRSDLKNMQQSVNAAYRLESAQNLNVGVDADTQIRLNEAKTEAKTRQLLNKVEFLKSQLAAEQASGEELRAVVDGNRSKIDEMRDEFRARLQEIEANKVAAIEDAERRTAVQYESRMAELTTLQTKMMMIQGQLQDAFQDGAVLKQREEAAKLAAAKAQSAQSVLRAEIEQLRNQLLEAREEKDLVQAQSGNKQANDAIVRRLDNERQYLKSQLASEITHKNEMQNALAQCQHQLNEVQRQWKQDVESLRETAQKDTHEAIGREQRLQQTNIALEGEVSRFESSNKDLKEAFVKMRDQVRMEQLAMENANSVNRRLQEQLDMTRTDLSRLRQVEEQSADAHRQQIAALKSAMAEGDARKVKETNRLKEELSTQYLLYSVAQKETLTVRNQFQDEKKVIARQNGALRIVTCLKHWQLARLACALRTWSTNTTLVGVAAQFRSHVNDLMKDTLAEVRAEKEAALEALRADMNREHDTHLEEIQTELERVHQQVRVDTEEEKNVALERQQEEFKRHLQECEAKWQYEMDAAVAVGEDKVLRAVQQSDVRLSEILARNKLDNDGAMEDCQREALEAQERAIQSTVQEWMIKLEVREKELQELQSRAVIEIMAENTVHERAAAKAAKEERAALSKQMEEERNAALDQAHAEFEVKMEALREKLLAEQATAIENVRDDYEDIMRNARQEQFEANEQRVRELRAAWVEESNEAMLAKDKAFEEGLQEKMDAHAKVVEAERLRGIKLESSKWRQALKDAEHRFELEVGKAKAEGRGERDKEAKAEMVQVEANHDFAMQLVKAEHEKATMELNSEHESAMKEEKRIRGMEKLEAMRKSEAMTKEALDREFGDRMKKAVDDAWDDSAKMWQAKLQKEEERLEKFKRDVAAQQQLLAAERNELQERVNQSDELMKRIESLSQSEMNQMRKDFDAERTMLELKFSKAQKSALKDLAKEQNETLENVEAKYKDISDRRIRAEKTKMEEEMNKQISQLQFESEGLITGLEKAVADLKDEKTALNSELEKTATKLEDTEDSLYDLQQEMKKKDKEHSISHWRILTNVEKMRSRFQTGMLEFDREAAEREGKMKENFQKNLNEATLSVLKLASLLCEVETSRKKAHTVLLNYKSDELIEKRTLIRVLEKDLERLTMEKDSLEEQRDLMEEEIEALEGQVRELEEQIRDHSRTSSMQNGRVNVAHARKKRRLDSDLERVLETIEQKRINMGEMDERAADKARARDEKEAEMVDLEKQLVGILVSQQRQVLARIEEMRGAAEDKARLVMHIARLPWPPPETPTMSDVLELVERDAAGREAEDK